MHSTDGESYGTSHGAPVSQPSLTRRDWKKPLLVDINAINSIVTYTLAKLRRKQKAMPSAHIRLRLISVYTILQTLTDRPHSYANHTLSRARVSLGAQLHSARVLSATVQS